MTPSKGTINGSRFIFFSKFLSQKIIFKELTPIANSIPLGQPIKYFFSRLFKHVYKLCLANCKPLKLLNNRIELKKLQSDNKNFVNL